MIGWIESFKHPVCGGAECQRWQSVHSVGARKQRLREDEAKVKMHLPRLQRPLSSGQACFSVPTALHRPPNMTPPLIRSESS